MTIAFLFPGQGSQSVGMSEGLDADTFAEADDTLGYALSAIIREGPVERLAETEITQPALLATSIAAVRTLAAARPELVPSLAAGHSLGEYGALVLSGSLSFADALRLVRLRGRAMQAAVPMGVGTMAAVMGPSVEEVQALCQVYANEEVVEIAAVNCPGQTVIAGHVGAVQRVCAAIGSGARLLQVSAPFHCSLLGPAALTLRAALAEVSITVPRLAVVHNVDADVASDPEGIRSRLVEQVIRPVRWVDCVHRLRALGAVRCIEAGPGRTLAGLGRRIDRAFPVMSATEAACG